MNIFLKAILVIVVIAYVVSPIDLVPGPIDDFIVILLSAAVQKGASMIEED